MVWYVMLWITSHFMFIMFIMWYMMVWYSMVMLAGRLWSDYVRPVPSLPSPLPGPVTYVTPEHNADSVTTNSTTSTLPSSSLSLLTLYLPFS